jgi:hypothetical protein
MADETLTAAKIEEGELSGDELQGVTGGSASYANLVMRTGGAADAADPEDPEDLVMVTCPKCKKKIRPALFPYHLGQHAKQRGGV